MSELPGRLRVVTLNIWNRQGAWDRRRDLIRKELEALAPDLIGLQEVLRFDSPAVEAPALRTPNLPAPDQAMELADGFGYRTAYAPAWDIGGGLSMGNALLSRWPIIEQRTIDLPHEGGGESRCALFARVEAPFGRVPVFVTHLNWKFHHGSIRVRQVVHLGDCIQDLAPVDSPDFPPIVMGDFNAEPDSDEIRYLKGLATLEGRSIYLCDTWAYAGPGGVGATFARGNGYAAEGHEVDRRIDYIFVRGPDRNLCGKPLRTRLCFTAPVAGPDGAPAWPSDHYGVMTDLGLGRQ